MNLFKSDLKEFEICPFGSIKSLHIFVKAFFFSNKIKIENIIRIGKANIRLISLIL